MTPIQESELLLPTAEHIRDSEELLPCSCLEKYRHDGDHNSMCPAHYRPTIAQSLASRDAKHALEIAGRDARIAALEKIVGKMLGDVSGIHPMFGGTPNVRDLCYTAWSIAKGHNTEDGGHTDWFNDTLPIVDAGIKKMADALKQDGPAS